MGDGSLIWLASYPKSGNTWMRCLIEAYRNNGYLDINNIRSSFGDSGELMYQAVSPTNAAEISEAEVYLLRPAALMNAMTQFKPPRIVKTHFANLTGPIVPPMIPPQITKCGIYIVRDPRSVAVSWSKHFAHNMDNVVQMMGHERTKLSPPGNDDGQCIVYASSWSNHVQSWTDEERFPVLIIKYEDLLEDTEKHLKAVVDFLNWENDDARIKKAVRASALSKLKKQECESGFKEKSQHTEKFFTNGGTRWKDELAPIHIRQIEKDHRVMMKKCGYL